MKKISSFIILVISILLVSGCASDSMEDIDIYTSSYPIEYVTSELYSDYSTIYNMYPQGINPYNYKFTGKQISDYGNSDLVIYDGIGKEKDYIVKMLNKNKNLKIIDATNRITINKTEDEIWINPSNILMISRNIRDGLKEYVNSALIEKAIDENYEKLKINISNVDVDLKEMGENSTKKTIITQDSGLSFLSKYNLNVIVLDETSSDKLYSDTSSLIDDEGIKYVYIFKDEKENEIIERLKSEHEGLETLYLDPINNISTSDKNEGKDYISIMNENIDKLKQELY